ncbi:heme-binding protein [Microbacterium thalassium]|uniref:Uncharacterized protein n=1 Tax=Microbacterium thalassium TaxID=362649 RepID=A0A7X0KVH0_9MICO|nr:heme-binding protein [Microbacterium thalassium]MBB6392237.1 hypothetical protein [Microbacterium thalassium]GLK23448.1 hypothetical protein GCM10017607_07660 [Microbacterium thalassium]
MSHPGDARYADMYRANSRVVELATEDDEELGPFKKLPGKWGNTERLKGRGWNMIALPFVAQSGVLDYRLLVNRFDEEITFSLVDKRVPNRGVDRPDRANTDQLVVTLDYEQMIAQSDADDMPSSGLAGGGDLAIHHEPGLFLNMGEPRTNGISIARLASVPHGDSALGLGRVFETDRPAFIDDISGLPIGVNQDLDSPYLAPYRHYHDNPFLGLFDPVRPNQLLNALPQNVVKNTVLQFDTKLAEAGIHNIPFIERQADASEMTSTFWILELDGDGVDEPNLLLAYTQTVMLEFFDRRDGVEGLIKWPHVSINVMEKLPDAEYDAVPRMPV